VAPLKSCHQFTALMQDYLKTCIKATNPPLGFVFLLSISSI